MRENPVKAISKPAAPAHRDKVLSRAEIYKCLRQLGRNTDTVSARVGLAFLFAFRTGMRAGEICGLRWLNVQEKAAFLPSCGCRSFRPLNRILAEVGVLRFVVRKVAVAVRVEHAHRQERAVK